MFIRATSTVKIDSVDNITSSLRWRDKYYAFFNSGNEALKEYLSQFTKNSKIAIQYYTCHSVVDTIHELGLIPVYMDIDTNYFSSPFSEVQRVVEEEKIDVLIVTHLFGIPNPDRIEIGNYVKELNIPIIDDLCQTVGAKIQNEFIENIADAFFYSFYIDKPIGYFNGGLLCSKKKINSSTIPINENGKKTLQLLKSVINYTKSPKYKPRFNPYSLLTHFIIKSDNYVPKSIVESILFSSFTIYITRVFDKLFGRNRIYPLDEVVCSSILSSLSSYNDEIRHKVLLRAVSKYNLQIPYNTISSIEYCVGSRAAVLTEDPQATSLKMRKDGYEVGLFNWSFDNVPDGLVKTKYVLKHMLNIPTWGADFYLE